MTSFNVYKMLSQVEDQFVETISNEEMARRTSEMSNADPEGMPSPHLFRDSSGQLWGFAEVEDGVSMKTPPTDDISDVMESLFGNRP